jgi:hypothetical protein
MINSIPVVSFEINCNLEKLENIISEDLDSNIVRWTKNQNEAGISEFILFTNKASLEIGHLVAKPLDETRTELIIIGVLVHPEDGKNDERFSLLRTTAKGLLSTLHAKRGLLSLEEVNRGVFWLDRPKTPSEREKVDQEDKEQLEKKRKEGFYLRVLFDVTCKTKPSKVEGILYKYRISKIREGNSFWGKVQIREVHNIPYTTTYEINPQSTEYFEFGKIEVTPVNEKKVQVQLLTAWDKLPFMEVQEAKNLYFEALSELESLAEYLRSRFEKIKPSALLQDMVGQKINKTGHEYIEELKKEVSENSNNRQKQIDAACVVWANRDLLLNGEELTDFLSFVNENTGFYISKAEFQRALRDAYSRGLITKVNRHWRPIKKM